MKNRLYRFVAAIVVGIPGVAVAGAGANMNACVYVPTGATAAMSVSVNVGGSGTHCMNASGKSTTISVASNATGVICASVGYVEEKGSDSHGDTCASDTSKWPISYSVAGTRYSGSEIVSMEADSNTNKAYFLNVLPKDTTVFCNSAAMCTGTSVTWNKGTQGPLYVIFTLN